MGDSGGGFFMILGLLFLAFVGFMIYFIFKALQFVIQAVDLYKDMVRRLDKIIELLSSRPAYSPSVSAPGNIQKPLSGGTVSHNTTPVDTSQKIIPNSNEEAHCSICKQVDNIANLQLNSKGLYCHQKCPTKTQDDGHLTAKATSPTTLSQSKCILCGAAVSIGEIRCERCKGKPLM